MTMVDPHGIRTPGRVNTARLTVVGVGDTDRDDAAVIWALTDRDRLDDNDIVHLVHSYVPVGLDDCAWPPIVEKRDVRRLAARQVVAKALQRARARDPLTRFDGTAVAGLTVDVLLEFSLFVDRVVVTEDVDGVSILHQVAHRLAGSAKCPTVVVPPAFNPAAVAPLAPVTLLLDTAEVPGHAIEYAYEEARKHGVSLCVAQVWSSWREAEPVTPELIAERQMLLDEQLVQFERGPDGVGVISQLIRDDFDGAVGELRRASRCLVVGSKIGRLARLTGPSPVGSCPLIVIPEPAQPWR